MHKWHPSCLGMQFIPGVAVELLTLLFHAYAWVSRVQPAHASINTAKAERLTERSAKQKLEERDSQGPPKYSLHFH